MGGAAFSAYPAVPRRNFQSSESLKSVNWFRSGVLRIPTERRAQCFFYGNDISIGIQTYASADFTSTKHTSSGEHHIDNVVDGDNMTVDKPSVSDAPKYRVQLLESVTEMTAQEWDFLARGGCASPFLRHDWLRCLEESNSATAVKGWSASHIVIRDAETNNIVALVPAYVKTHSLGEFVFDQEWADAAYGAGIAYYPKLLLAVPFTPATGRRILTPPDIPQEDRERVLRLVANILIRVCAALPVSSVHVNFCRPDEAAALSSEGFLRRKGVQYHFTNYRKGHAAIAELEQRLVRSTNTSDVGDNSCNDDKERVAGTVASDFTHEAEAVEEALREGIAGSTDRTPYRDFEDYLSEFKSKRRIKMRRERAVVRNESGLDVEVVRGDAIDTALLLRMYEIYKSTIDKLLFGRQYLNKRFFELLSESDEFKQHLCLVVARRRSDGIIIGGTFNVISDSAGTASKYSNSKDNGAGPAFYGRYWGCTEEYRFLHFEACYYAAIEYCIENGLSRMEPGAGGGEFKYMRGFEPAVTLSMHYLRDERLSDAVARYLHLETMHIDGAVSQMKRQSAIRSKSNSGKEFFL